jgi:hypothetical protein
MPMPSVDESRFLTLVPTQLVRLNAGVEELERALDRQTWAIHLLAVATLCTPDATVSPQQAAHWFGQLRSLMGY